MNKLQQVTMYYKDFDNLIEQIERLKKNDMVDLTTKIIIDYKPEYFEWLEGREDK